MQIYLVGGAVRDALLGLPVRDRDWVVVGATPDELTARGYVPVGKDFPVFLHPQTREEYALARTERKTARGYHGFSIDTAPDVTLEQDLARRDLTINAIATSLSPTSDASCGPTAITRADFGSLIDPHGGVGDLQARVLRHVTLAFCEDPVRILRLARFAARFADFSVAPETLTLMRQMVDDGEVDALVPERVWQELARGLMEQSPQRMLEVLDSCGALHRLLPELEWTPGGLLSRRLEMAACRQTSLGVRFACVGLSMASTDMPATESLTALCQRLRVPSDHRELASLVLRECTAIAQSSARDATALVKLLERCDAFRKPLRFADALLACACDALSMSSAADVVPAAEAILLPYTRLAAVLVAAQTVATGPVARAAQAAGLTGPAVGSSIEAARIDAVESHLRAIESPPDRTK